MTRAIWVVTDETGRERLRLRLKRNAEAAVRLRPTWSMRRVVPLRAALDGLAAELGPMLAEDLRNA